MRILLSIFFSGALLLVFPTYLLVPEIVQLASRLSPEKASLTASEVPTLPTVPDTANCSEVYVVERDFDFVPVLKCQYLHPGIITYCLPLFADIDGDGETEIIATFEHSPNGFAVLNPNDCEPEHIVTVEGAINLKDGGPVLGDVDRNGYVDIFITGGTRIYRWEYNPSSQKIEKIWETPTGISLAERPHLDIWDLNQDGQAEIIPNQGQMVNGVTGRVYPDPLPLLHPEGKALFAFTADAIPGDAPGEEGNVELLYGTHAYRYDFGAEKWVLVRKLPDIDWGFVANVSIADMDLDGDVDAVITQWDEIGQALIWDIQTDEMLGGGVFDYPGQFGSRMNIANMDDDPHPEMVMTCVFNIFAMDDIVNSGSFGNLFWLDETSDESGHTQLTSFDFDGNGSYEIAYRDETQVRIFSGLGTGVPTGIYPSSPLVLLDSGDNSCESFTGMEYPTIGDIDNDNEAEIVATCKGSINIYESGSLPWGDASKVWNTQAFNVTCVNQDGTIPAVPVENYKVYNNFLAQVNLNPRSDTLFIPLTDATADIQEFFSNCDGGITLTLEICNQGAADLPEGTPVALYWSDPTQGPADMIDLFSLNEKLLPSSCTTIETEGYLPPGNVGAIYVVVNDDGTFPLPYILDSEESGGNFPFTEIEECDYSNNIASTAYEVGFDQEFITEEEICLGDSVIFENIVYAETGVYEHVYPNALGCDSTLILDLTVFAPIRTADFATICEGESYPFKGQFFEEAGAYKDTVTSLSTGCDSIVTLVLEVIPKAQSSFSAFICQDGSFEYNGIIYKQAGQYSQTFTLLGRCDSVVNFEIEVLPPMVSTVTREICQGDVISFGGQDFSEPGFYSEIYGADNGCDSIVNLDLIVNPIKETRLNRTICAGDNYDFHGQTISEAGSYSDVFSTTLGCDSTVTLDLNVLENDTTNITTIICTRGSFLYNGILHSESGEYSYGFPKSNGCDSLVNLTLIKNPPNIANIFYEICEGEIFYIGQEPIQDPGIYSGVLEASDGCDSITTVQLIVHPRFEKIVQAEVCEDEFYEFQGQVFRESGFYSFTYDTQFGCDSILSLDLTVHPISITHADSVICDGDIILFNMDTIRTAGEYIEVLPNANSLGCDSITVLNVEVLPSPQIMGDDARICFGESVQLQVEGSEEGYLWSPDLYLSCNDCSNPVATPDESITYTITSTGCKGRAIETQVSVEVLKVPEIFLGEDMEITFGDELVLEPLLQNYSGEKIRWEENGRTLCDDCFELRVRPFEETTYLAYVENDFGCYNVDDITVYLRKNCIEEDFFIPNMFSPNGDGINENFYVEAYIDAELKWLHIYDRWGERLFSTSSFDDKWDGYFRGQPLIPGVYVYHFQIVCPDGTVYTRLGNVTLIK